MDFTDVNSNYADNVNVTEFPSTFIFSKVVSFMLGEILRLAFT